MASQHLIRCTQFFFFFYFHKDIVTLFILNVIRGLRLKNGWKLVVNTERGNHQQEQTDLLANDYLAVRNEEFRTQRSRFIRLKGIPRFVLRTSQRKGRRES